MNLKMGSRIIAATGIAALLFALAACNQPNNASKGTQGQSTQTSKDELGLKDKIVPALTAAVSKLGAKKITLDANAKKFTIEADSTATELSATEIFSGTDFTGKTQKFTLKPASGSVTVAADTSKLTLGYAAKAEGDTYTATLTFTKDGKSSPFEFTVINKKKQPPKDELSLRDKVAKALANAVEDLKKKDINLTAAENKFVIGPDSAVTELSAKDIFKGTDFPGDITQEFKILTADPSVKLAGDKSKLTIEIAKKPEGDRAEVQLTFKKGTQVSEFKFTIINKKQNPLRDDLMLKEEVKKALSDKDKIEKLKEKNILFDPVEKKFLIKSNSEEVEFLFSNYFPKNNTKYQGTERELTITPAGSSITKGFSDTEIGSLDIGLAKDPKNGDTVTVMYKFTKEDGKKVSEFKFTFVNMRKKVYHKNQIKGQIERLVQDLNGDPTIWTSTKKYMYQYKDKNKAIRLPKKGDKDDIKNVALTWGLKKGHEHGARIDKNKDGESIVIIDDAKVNHKVVLTVTVALPGENMVFDELPDASNTNAYLAFSFFIES